jgi:ABC-2 type transport system permease protein
VAAIRPLIALAARGLMGRRRSLGVVLLVATPVAVAAILAVAGGLGEPAELAAELFQNLMLRLVIPLAALILGTGVLGALIDDGTIVYVLVKPLPRWTVVLAAMLVAGGATAALAVTAALVTGLLLVGFRDTGLLAGMVAGALLAGSLYAVVFVTVSVFTSRALVAGLGYVLIWEGIVTDFLVGTRILSIREYAATVANAVTGGTPPLDGSGLGAGATLVLAALALLVAFALGARRLGRFEVSEPA